MKSLLFIFLAVSVFANDTQLLAAIAKKESGNNPAAVSRSGDIGAHQMSPAAIRDNKTPERHLAWLKRQNDLHGIANSPFNLALEWRSGWTRATSGRAPDSHYQYAREVVALYETIAEKSAASAAVSPSMTARQPALLFRNEPAPKPVFTLPPWPKSK